MDTTNTAINSVGFAVLFLMILLLYAQLPHKKVRWKLFKSKNKDFSIAEYEAFIFQLSYSLHFLSKHKIGALVVIENVDNLKKYVSLGYSVTAKLTSELLITVFGNKKSALHDGGVIVRKFNVISVSSYFPVTQKIMTSTYGARHRSATGLTEETDAIALIVSETTGNISYSKKGKIHALEKENLDVLCDNLFELLNFYIN
ncbi:diadenylate cyclase CdaM [Candidatus Mycoplasma haematobovis]|nr:diadenylate cyclase CdaM [Candidatus Mycoplasma haematobovis]